MSLIGRMDARWRERQSATPAAGEPWVWLTRELLRSDAWRSLGINGRRVVDFLYPGTHGPCRKE